MAKYLRLTVGGVLLGYKTVELSVDGRQVTYKILRNGFKHVDKNQAVVVNVADVWRKKFAALNIAAWKKNYGEKTSDVQWSLIFRDNDEIYRSHGNDAYPDEWDDFLDLLDTLAPELEFIDGKRIDAIDLVLTGSRKDFGEIFESLSLSRKYKKLIIDNPISEHRYSLSSKGTKEFFDICQKFFDNFKITEDTYTDMKLSVTLYRHDDTESNFNAPYSEFAIPNVTKFAEEIHNFAWDLSANIFFPENVRRIDGRKIILCKVQFKGSYKSYTYRAEDETLAVGDVVDVPVGRNNDVAQAKIVEIGYFDADDTPFPAEKIKTVIGKHVDNSGWEDY